MRAPMRMLSAAVATVLSLSAVADEPELIDVSESSGIYRELRTTVDAWLAAVRSHDEKTLVGLAAPEARETIAAALSDPNSVLSGVLFSGNHSVRARFSNARNVHVYLFAHANLRKFGNGTTACVSAEPITSPLPTRVVDLPESAGSMRMFCQFFWRGDGNWYPNWAYGWPDEGRAERTPPN